MGKKANVHNMGYKWPKGVSGNPSGRPKTPEALRKVKALSPDTVNRMLNKYGQMTVEELKAAIADPSTPALELTIASILMNAIKEGDYARVEFFLNRTIGKVKEEKEVNVNLHHLPQSEVITLAKEAIEYLEASPESAEFDDGE